METLQFEIKSLLTIHNGYLMQPEKHLAFYRYMSRRIGHDCNVLCRIDFADRKIHRLNIEGGYRDCETILIGRHLSYDLYLNIYIKTKNWYLTVAVGFESTRNFEVGQWYRTSGCVRTLSDEQLSRLFEYIISHREEIAPVRAA